MINPLENYGTSPLVGFNFMLRVELAFDLPCKSVHSFTREMEYELIQEGGLNDYVHMRRKQQTHPFTFEVERYAGNDLVDPLPLGAELSAPVLLFVSRSPSQFGTINVSRTFSFFGCRVTKRAYGQLDAEHSGLVTDITTIAYNQMLLVDIPY